jgi:hypothetical protein
MYACAAATVSHLAHVRVLADSLRAQHPGARLTVLLVDDPHGRAPADARWETLRPADIGLERRELHRMAAMYTAGGLANACQSLLMLHLADRDGEPLLQLDVDMCVYAPLDDVGALAARHGVLLSPHTTLSVADARGRELERRLLGAGAFNAGLIGAGPAGRPFLVWMAERVRRDCVIDIPSGLHHRQRWLDLVPALFPHHVLRDRGVNAMGWSLLDGDLREHGGAFEIGGRPLRLFHFCGRFDPLRADRLTTLPGLPWPDLSERPVTARLCADYARRLRAAGYAAVSATPYGYERLLDGMRVDAPMRHAYRAALLAAESGHGAEPPNPFEPEEAEAFVAWLGEPAGGCSRYLLSLWWLRADLRAAFPHVAAGDAFAYLAWVAAEPANATVIPEAFRQPIMSAP